MPSSGWQSQQCRATLGSAEGLFVVQRTLTSVSPYRRLSDGRNRPLVEAFVLREGARTHLVSVAIARQFSRGRDHAGQTINNTGAGLFVQAIQYVRTDLGGTAYVSVAGRLGMDAIVSAGSGGLCLS